MPVAATIEIACDADAAWALLADPSLAPDWVTAVADAEVLERDAAGRPVRVRFVGMPSVGSATYVVAYRHDDATRSLWWETVGEADRRMDGHARIEPVAAGRCRLHYELAAAANRTLPPWAQSGYAGDTPDKVVAAFERFARRRLGVVTGDSAG